jgi:hypothetical protein
MDRVETKRALEAFHPRAKRVVNKVDPLDLVKMGASKDEYDDLVAEAARWLAAEVGDFEQRLGTYVRSHYGVQPDRERIAKLAKELRAAWQSSR